MSSNNTIVTDMFNAFTMAQKAMDELPVVQAELAQAKEALLTSNDEVIRLRDELTKWRLDHTSLQNKLSAREAELAQATFREQEVRSKHEALRAVLVAGLGSVDHKAGEVSTQTQGGAQENPTEAAASSEGSVSADPTKSAPTTAEQSTSTSQTNGDTSGQSDADPTHTAASQAGATTPASAFSKNAEPLVDAPSNPAPEVADHMGEGTVITPSETYVVASNGAVDTTSAVGNTSNIHGHIIDSSPTLAFISHHYHSKPEGMEWGYWIVNGGEPAPWMGQRTIDDLKASNAMWIGHANREHAAA